MNCLSKAGQLIQKERAKYSLNPFRLISSNTLQIQKINKLECPKIPIKLEKILAIKDKHLISKRYEDEIAPPNKMKEYQEISTKYKSLLFSEAIDLQNQYSNDVKIIYEVENAVERISSMLSEFVQIVYSQSSQVEDVYEASSVATDFVKESNRQLQLTIERSKSSQWNMIILSFSLAVLLLLLDYFTP